MVALDPSGSICSQIAGMEVHRFSATSGSSSSGNGGRSVGNTSSRRRSRMSNPPSGTRLMSQFNAAAAADGGGSGSSTPVRLETALDEWRLRNIRFRSLPEAPPTPNQVVHLLLHGSPMRAPVTDDDVLIMDGVLISNGESRNASSTRRCVSFSDLGLIANRESKNASNTKRSISFSGLGSSGGSSCGPNCQVNGSSSSHDDSGSDSSTALLAGLLGSGDGSSCCTRRCASFGDLGLIGSSESRNASFTKRSISFSDLGSSGGSSCRSNCQFSEGRERPHRMQTMRPSFSEVVSQNSAAGSSNRQGSPIIQRNLLSPWLPRPAVPTAAPRAVSSNTDAATTIRPPASYCTPPRVTVTAARPSPSTPTQPETEPVQATTPSFAWPPSTEEDNTFAQRLYGPITGARPRLPVFQAICSQVEV